MTAFEECLYSWNYDGSCPDDIQTIEIVMRVRKTSSEAFEEFITPHFSVLHRVAYRLSGNVHDAEDLVQDVCMKAYPKLDELKRFDKPRSWLLRVLYNRFVDTTRRWDYANITSLSSVESDDCRSILASNAPGPEECTETAMLESIMEKAWRRMERRQRALLALHDVEGYSLAELQSITDTKIGTLKSQLHRARVRLGKLLQREEHPVAVVAKKEG